LLAVTHYIYRKHTDNSELVENAATLLMELANYREFIVALKKSHFNFVNTN